MFPLQVKEPDGARTGGRVGSRAREYGVRPAVRQSDGTPLAEKPWSTEDKKDAHE